jgi:enoyl-CoA hydratase/carnithine racemase
MSVVQIESIKNYEILRFNRGKANPINTELCDSITSEIKRIEGDQNVRGLIITGNTPGYFSVGLDLKELYYFGEKEISNFWSSWENMIMTLLQFKKPLISAINGYSPAGGCVIAITCDYRVMADGEKFLIGLNETSVGIVVPEYIFHLYQFWIGKLAAFEHLMDGSLHSPQKALELGLVNEICDVSEVVERAQKKLEFWLSKPDNILQNSKMNLKSQLLKDIKSAEKISKEERLRSWFDPKSREVMSAIVAHLSK